jgi:hypothetical protein
MYGSIRFSTLISNMVLVLVETVAIFIKPVEYGSKIQYVMVRRPIYPSVSEAISRLEVHKIHSLLAYQNGFRLAKFPTQHILLFVNYDQYTDAFIYHMSMGFTYECDSIRHKYKITVKLLFIPSFER